MNDEQSLATSNGHRPLRERAESWVAFALRTAGSLVGLAILAGQAFGFADPRFPLTVAGVGLCGPVVAAAAGSFFESVRIAK